MAASPTEKLAMPLSWAAAVASAAAAAAAAA
eukprot:CAMPEP_0115874128 /NCGR_PEP_ID=MMETSP0287-20121206/24369_1 /TAXON_ID=412157 /ORGANISM="Chrysochromulina rotalis, Strain UIO044" /LENGTH=30 /DNA_ID= /DNA_START= /DNA_END= /DNA_ORIENTATION=